MKKMPVKKKVGVKKLENRPKSGREIVFLPVKKSKKRQKMAFTGTFFFHGKKKHWMNEYDVMGINQCVYLPKAELKTKNSTKPRLH